MTVTDEAVLAAQIDYHRALAPEYLDNELAWSPDLPGCLALGDTVEECLTEM